MLTATPLYAALLVPLFLTLSVRVILYRRRNRVAYGDNAYPPFQAMIGAQRNFAEYVPFTLLLMALAELNGIAPALIHATGLLLLVGRHMHGLGMAFRPRDFRFRVWGMWLTFTALALAGLLCLAGLLP